MTTLTITLMEAREQGALVSMVDDRGRSCVAEWHSDGSRRAVSGARWMVEAARNEFGRATLNAAVQQVRMDGRVVLSR